MSFNKRTGCWILLLVLPLVVAALITPAYVERHTSARLAASLSELRDTQLRSIEKALQQYSSTADSFASNPELLKLMTQFDQYRLRRSDVSLLPSQTIGVPPIDLTSERPFENWLVSHMDSRPVVSAGVLGLQLLATDGSVLGESAGFNWVLADPTLVFKVMKTRETSINSVYSENGESRLPLITPMRNSDQRLLGALVTVFAVAPILHITNEHESAATTTESYVINAGPYGQIEPLSRLRPGGLVASRANAAFDAPDGKILPGKRDSSGITLAVTTIPETGWGLVVASSNIADNQLLSGLRILTLIAGGVTLIILLVGWFLIIRAFNQRLATIAIATSKMEKRDYKICIDDNTDDHAGTIARNVERIAGELTEGISVRMVVEQRIQQMADRDELTGVYNQEYITDALDRFSNNEDMLPVTIACITLRGYESVKSTHGDTAAQDLLVAAANRLQSTLGHQHIVARRSSNEFVILASGMDEAGATGLNELLNSAFSTSFETTAGELLLSCEVGIVTAKKAADLYTIMDEADLQLKQLRTGSDTPSPDDTSEPATNKQVRLIDAAIKESRVNVWFQPIVRLTGGEAPQLVAAEALVRVFDEQGGPIPPNSFMQEIQDYPVGQLLDRMVLTQSLETLNSWHTSGRLPEDFKLTINLSRPSVYTTDIVRFLQQQLSRLECPPSHLVLEISGGTQVLNVDVLADLRELGITLAMDDVGLEHSNLEQLITIEPSFAKIDQRRLQSRSNEETDAHIQTRLNTLLQSMGTEIIAKSVESADQIAELKGRGISLFQGFLFGRPVEADAFIEQWGTGKELRKAG